MNSKPQRRTKKLILTISLIVLMLIVILVVLANFILEGIVEEKLRSKLNQDPESIHKTDFKALDINILKRSITLRNITLTPREPFSDNQNNNKIKYETDLFTVSADKLKVNGIELSNIIKGKDFSISSLEILKPNIKISRDKTLPDKPYKYKPLIASLIKKIPLTFFIDSILIRDLELSYYEKLHVSGNYGEVNFDQLYLSAYNITNDSGRLSTNQYLDIDVKGRIMKEGAFDLNLTFDLLSKNDYLTAQGQVGPISGTAFNKMTKELIHLEIKKGDIKNTEFNFTANDDLSQGELILIYENLSVEILKSKKENKQSKFLTFVSNTAIKNTNFPDDPHYRTGIIYFKRDKNKALPNYLWKSIRSGLVSIIAPLAESKEQHNIYKQSKKESKDKKRKNRKDKPRKQRN